MIERATSCLNAGVRQPESRRCVQRALGSKRLLHSAFWHHHAANNFDLSPFALTSTSNAAASGLEPSSSHRKGKSRARPFITCSKPEPGVFLDFLYPPQALAYLHRADLRSTPVCSNRDRWEYRNTRRVPEGRLQAARGYASKSFSPESGAAAEDGKKEHDDEIAEPGASASDSVGDGSSKGTSNKEAPGESGTLQTKQQGIGDADDPNDGDAFAGIDFNSLSKSKRKLPGSLEQGSRRNIDDTAALSKAEPSKGQQVTSDAGDAEEPDAFAGIDFDSLPASKLTKLSKQEKRLKKKEKRKAGPARYRSAQSWEDEPSAFDDFATQDVNMQTQPGEVRDSLFEDESDPIMPDVPVEINELEIAPGEDIATMRELRRIVARKPAIALTEDDVLPAEDPLGPAMELYNKLNTQTKPSATLSALIDALLNWLAEHRTDEAEQHFITVWNSAPMSLRGVKPFEHAFVILRKHQQPLEPVYKVMFEAFPLRTEVHAAAFQSAYDAEDWDSAFQIHTEAVDPRPRHEHDGLEYILFRCCERINSEDDRRRILGVTNWARQLPGPTPAVKSLKLDAEDKRSRNAFASSLCRFVAAEVTQRLLGSAFFLQRDDPRLNRRQTTYKSRRGSLDRQDYRIEESVALTADLMNFILVVGPGQDGTAFADKMMMGMLSLPAKKDDNLTYQLVASFYRSFRDTPGAFASEALLLPLLERSLRWEGNAARSEDNLLPLDMIIHDWEVLHQKLSETAYIRIIRLYADIGEVDLVNTWFQDFKQKYRMFAKWVLAWWCLVLVHVRNADVAGADQAFREIASEEARFNRLPNHRCWTALIHTYARADDVKGTMGAFQAMIDASERDPRLVPNEYVYGIVSNMLARKGDVKNVQLLLKQHDAHHGNARSTPLVGAEILALLEDDRMAEAKEVLHKSVEQVRRDGTAGAHTKNFNQVLTALAVARDLQGAVSLYNDMKSAQIPPDSGTFAALILALSGTRHDDAAMGVIRFQMPKEGLMPTALHFGIVMQGYLHVRAYAKIIWANGLMQRMNIKPDAKTEECYLTARSFVEIETEGKNVARKERESRRGRDATKISGPFPGDGVGYRPGAPPPSPAEAQLFDGEFPDVSRPRSKGKVKLPRPVDLSEEDAFTMEFQRLGEMKSPAPDTHLRDDGTSQPQRGRRTKTEMAQMAEVMSLAKDTQPRVDKTSTPQRRGWATTIEPSRLADTRPRDDKTLTQPSRGWAKREPSRLANIQPREDKTSTPQTGDRAKREPSKLRDTQPRDEKTLTPRPRGRPRKEPSQLAEANLSARNVQPRDDKVSNAQPKPQTNKEPSSKSAKPVGRRFGPITRFTLQRLRTRERKVEAQLLDEYLIETVKDFEDTMPFAKGESPSGTMAQIKADGLSTRQYLDHNLQVYGAEKTLDAVRDLFDRYFARGVDPPIAILTYLMRSLHDLKQYKEVGSCWELAKEQADRMVAPVTLPDLRPPAARAAAPDDSALSIKASKETSDDAPSGRRLMLSRPALFYINTLVATNRISDAINLVTSLNNEGYSLDNMTWNSFIMHLCSADPPFALLAFQLTERFLIPKFPGWKDTRWTKPNMQDRLEGLQHIKARYIRVDDLMPKYETVIFLSHALLTLRHYEGQGTGYLEAEHLEVDGVNLARYVGRLRQIRENAPRTLYAVQCMPQLDDNWQRELRHEDGSKGDFFKSSAAKESDEMTDQGA